MYSILLFVTTCELSYFESCVQIFSTNKGNLCTVFVLFVVSKAISLIIYLIH